MIRDAVDRQMAHVRTYHLGPQADLSQKILNEIAAAKACLLDPKKKAAYDAQLRQKLAQAQPSVAIPDVIKRIGDARLDQFVQHVMQSGLISAAEISRSLRQPPARETSPRTPNPSPAHLVKASKLTKYQAELVYQGKIKGLVFGEYRVLDKLGEGGMGVVLKAQHRRMKRVVAVKMISGAALKSPDAVKRFYREVEAAAKLDHPNIVTAYDAGEHEGVHYLVMEYRGGQGPGRHRQGERSSAGRPGGGLHHPGGPRTSIRPRARASSTATSSLPICWWTRKARSKSSTWGWLGSAGWWTGGRQGPPDRQRSGDGHLRLHGSRAGDGHPPCRCPSRHLLAGLHVVSAADGRSAVQGRDAGEDSPGPSASRRFPRSAKHAPTCRRNWTPCSRRWSPRKPEDRQQSMTEVIADLETCVGKRSATCHARSARSPPPPSRRRIVCSSARGSPHRLATAAKKKVEKLAEATIAHQAAAAETSKQLGSDERLQAVWRKKKTLVVAIGCGLLGVIGIVVLAVTIRVRHPDGKETVVTVPNGSKVTVSENGDVEVTVEARKPAMHEAAI